MHSIEIAWALKELADLLEFKGEDFFKIRAYRRAAKALVSIPGSVEEMYQSGTLKNVPGIGKNILAKIGELLETGECRLLRRLREEVPPGLLEVMALPGMGPKRARIFYEHLHISNLQDLEQAAREKKIRALPGMGAKREREILYSIKRLKASTGHFLISVARHVAGEFEEFFNHLPAVDHVSITGSVRRWRETVQDVDILIGTLSPEEVLPALDRHPLVTGILSRDNRRVSLMTRWGIPVEILVVSPGEFFTALVNTTGNSSHWNALRNIAAKQGMMLEKEGVYDSKGEIIPVSSEEDIYRCLGLSFIPPEMREDRGEIALASVSGLPNFVGERRIKGDLHVHSNWSDGGNTIEELVDRARQKGYRYMAITDHSRSLKIAGGLSVEQLLKQKEYIASLNKNLKDFQVLRGIEVDILSNGTLDYPDEILAGMDVVIASVHSAFKQDREKMTRRIISAIENPHVDIIAHLTGRLIGRREGYQVDVEAIIKKAAENNTALEINSSPDRLDLDENNARLAAEYGVKLVINTDAHDLGRMDEINYGLAVARRAWLGPEDVLNTMDLPDLLNYLGKCNG